MPEVVIDTNVMLVASLRHSGVSPKCILACVERIEKVKEGRERVVIDDAHRILGEYQKKLGANKGKGAGEAFLKWLLQNKANRKHVVVVALTERAPDDFDEFPDAALAAEFDPPDRKFVAAAHAHPRKPTVLQATDSKWLRWHEQLAAHGIRVEFLCKNDICRFYNSKYPDGDVPPVP